jgi:hypothetical protein
MGNRRTPLVRRSLLGNALIAVGAVSGAFGAVGWLAALRYPSLVLLVLGVVFFGLVPLIAGMSMVWYGLDLLEEDLPRLERVGRSRIALLEAAKEGATATQVARRLRLATPSEIERELDGLVLEELLELDVTDDGELIYHAPGRRPTLPPLGSA